MNKRVTKSFLKFSGKSDRPAAKKRSSGTFIAALLILFSSYSVYPAVSENWTINDNLAATTVVNGVTIDWKGVPSDKDYKNSDFDNDVYWADPFNGPFSGGDSLEMHFRPFGTVRTITVTFSRPVDNPVLHIGRIGDHERKFATTSVFSLSSFSAASSDVTVSQLAGNLALQVDAAAKSFQRAVGRIKHKNNCKDFPFEGTGCGSVQFTGTGITSLTFNVTWDGADNGDHGDKLEIRWSLGTSVIVRKQSVGTTGTYDFSGANGIGAFTLDTALSNPADSARYPITDNLQSITISESPDPATALTSVVCTDPAGNTVPSGLSGRTATLSSAGYFNINQLITCTLTNTLLPPPVVDLVKNCTVPADCLSAPQLSGTGLTYTIQFTNTGGQSAGALIIVDEIPSNTDYEVNSAAANPGTTGLTFAIEYSVDYNPGNPGAATWLHAPVSAAGGAPDGYDRLTKAIRWRVTSGSLSNTAPDNTADLSFRVRIR